MSVKTVLDNFGKDVIKQARQNLSKKKHKDTSVLYNSMKYDTQEHKNSFEFSISMAEYGKFVDKGVQGKKSNTKAPNSPFRFGTGTGKEGGLTEGINKWVAHKRFQFRDKKNGQFLSFKATSFLIIRSIYNTGIATTNFFTRPFNIAFKKLPNDIIEAYSLEVDDFLKFALK
ncbi:MAG: hypothetical protein HQ471_07750 [Flavobacteriales bacterium]|nr:hypothetical protein [Flavobacteriales bacterium]